MEGEAHSVERGPNTGRKYSEDKQGMGHGSRAQLGAIAHKTKLYTRHKTGRLTRRRRLDLNTGKTEGHE